MAHHRNRRKLPLTLNGLGRKQLGTAKGVREVNYVSQTLEDFLSDLATKPATATGYYPARAGTLPPEVLERDAQALASDPRIDSVERKFASGTLVQLWVVLD